MEKGAISFILYKPGVPGNIGASARAIKTMGFNDLRLVMPANHLADEAKMMAHGSQDILQGCTIFGSYDDAVADLDFIVCTTAKLKRAKVNYISSPELKSFLAEKIPVARKIGVVFGSEESGLPGNIIQKANAGITIPMHTSYPSLNLSQAVMVIAYELSGLFTRTGTPEEDPDPKQEAATWKELETRTALLLEKAGIKSSTPLYHRILERLSFLKAKDARLLHSITSRITDLVDREP